MNIDYEDEDPVFEGHLKHMESVAEYLSKYKEKKMITEIQIQNFLYEIDDELSDDQINSLAQKIYNNQKTFMTYL